MKRIEIELEIEGNIDDNLPEGYEIVSNTLESYDSEKGSVSNKVVLKRLSDGLFFSNIYTQYSGDIIEWESYVWKQVFQETRIIYK